MDQNRRMRLSSTEGIQFCHFPIVSSSFIHPIILLLLCIYPSLLIAFHTGAPCSTQYTMSPSAIFHGVPQNPGPRPPPYQLEIADEKGRIVNKYSSNHVYTVRLLGVGATFRGYLLQARPSSPEGYPIGHLRAGAFIPDTTWALQGIKYQPCPGVFNDSLTHSTNDDKSAMEVKWKPTNNYGPILFVVTILQNRTHFWTQWHPTGGFLVPNEEGHTGSTAGYEGVDESVIRKLKEKESGSEEEEEPAVPEDETSHTAFTTRRPSSRREGTEGSTEILNNKTTINAKMNTTMQSVSDPEQDQQSTTGPESTNFTTSKLVPATSELPESQSVNVSLQLETALPDAENDTSAETDLPSTSSFGRNGTEAPVLGDENSEEDSAVPETFLVGLTFSPFRPPPIAGLPSSPPAVVSSASPPAVSPSSSLDKEKTSEKLPPAVPVESEQFLEDLLNRTESPPAVPVDSEQFLEDLLNRTESTLSFEGSSTSVNGTKPLVLPSGDGSDPADATDYCGDQPCSNNGTCVNMPEEERYHCRCTREWTGHQCSDANHCLNHTCKNGARCANAADKYTCECTKGWGGESCDKSCPPYLCQNGGTCTVSENGKDDYKCICRPGWTGERCQKEINHCESNPCLNGGTCIRRHNAFECKCKNGFMGETCHRPCQDIYRSCDFWGEQDKCDSQRPATKWFDVNCAVTCKQCKHDNNTVNLTVTLPPVLEPFEFLLGRWTLNSTTHTRFPVDFIHDNSGGYYEEFIFSVIEVPQFGPPSINFTAIAVNNLNNDDVMINVGFLTVRPSTVPLKTFFLSTGNDGVTVVEEGNINGTLISLNAQYFAILPSVDDSAPAMAKRNFSIANQYLKMDVERSGNNGKKDYFTNYYWREEKFAVF